MAAAEVVAVKGSVVVAFVVGGCGCECGGGGGGVVGCGVGVCPGAVVDGADCGVDVCPGAVVVEFGAAAAVVSGVDAACGLAVRVVLYVWLTVWSAACGVRREAVVVLAACVVLYVRFVRRAAVVLACKKGRSNNR